MRAKTFKCVYPNLKSKILESGVGCADLAIQLKVSNAAMYKRLYGETEFLPEEIDILCRLFKSPARWLFFRETVTLEQLENQFYSSEKPTRTSKEVDLYNLGIVSPPKAKSYSFYLDEEVANELENLAAENGISKSKALNALLRKLLF